MEKAPIMVSVYDRIIHFRQCIESLKENKYADQSHLFIAIDAPYKDEHVARNRMCVEYAKSITGFKGVTIFIRDKNMGSMGNRDAARDDIFRKYNRLIMFEDDNVFAPGFLSYMNNGLNVYEKREDIFSVAAYGLPIQMPEHYKDDVYLIVAFTAWGVGIWRDKWNQVDWSLSEFNAFIDNKSELKKFSKTYEKAIPQLLKMRQTGHVTGDGLLLVHMYLHNMYSVYPVFSRVRNIGHDGSGEHCGGNKKSNKYMNQPIYEGTDDTVFPPDLLYNYKLARFIQKTNKYSYYKRIKIKLKKIIELLYAVKSFKKQQ